MYAAGHSVSKAWSKGWKVFSSAASGGFRASSFLGDEFLCLNMVLGPIAWKVTIRSHCGPILDLLDSLRLSLWASPFCSTISVCLF